MLTGKKIVLGVSGGIAAYKIANVASMLVKLNADVHVVMTEAATHFITPQTFEVLTNNRCYTDVFDRSMELHVPHVTLGTMADAILIAPASADIIGKISNGIADDMLTTTIMACKCPKLISPAMNTNMYENPIVQDNLKKLGNYGYEIIQPDSGRLACGDTGAGKMPSEEVLMNYILRTIARKKDMSGIKLCVSAGPTREKLDPVRFISNNSTGKMGYAIAKMAMLRGAYVTLVSGNVSLEPVPFVKMADVTSAQDMYDAVTECAVDSDIIIMAAAVADYRPATVSDQKIKKKDTDMSIALDRTKDILGTLGSSKREGLYLCGFSMETENLLENSRAKLDKKNLDLIVANNVKVEGAGFGTDTNIVTFISREETKELPIMSKEEVADSLLDYIMEHRK